MNQGWTCCGPARAAWVFGAALCGLAALLAASKAQAQSGSLGADRTGLDRDQAAGEFVDSLFDPLLEDRNRHAAAERILGSPSKATQRPQWTARLARNPNKGDGNPPYVLIDRYGGVQRYVEESPSVNLEKYLGQSVSVRRDTGHTLLASQLELPRIAKAASTAAKKQDGSVKLAAFEEGAPMEPTPADEPAMPSTEELPTPMQLEAEGEPMMVPDGVDPLYLDGGQEEGMHFEGCDLCGSKVCPTPGGCGYGSRPIIYGRAEYLLWQFDGMRTPPLVVAADNPNFENSSIIYGDDEILDDARHGGRFTIGYFLDDYGRNGIEGEYVVFGVTDETFVAGDLSLTQNLPPYIGRPFINPFDIDLNNDGDTNDAGEIPRGPAVEEVETDGLSGTVTVHSETQFESAGIRLRHALCCMPGCTDCGDAVGCGEVVGCGPMGCGSGVDSPYAKFFKRGTRRVDLITGFRWTTLDESINIEEDLTVIPSTIPASTFLLNDNFTTSNRFVGGEVGFLWEWLHNRWSLEFLSKMAIGSTRQRVFISGSTIFDRGTAGEEFATGGLLAQNSNIGAYERDQLSVIPELGVTVGYMVTDRLRLTAGYTFLYWSNVVRPGDQIDPEVNITQIPRFGGTPDVLDPITLDHPQFTWRQSDLWANGLNFGAEYRY